MRYGLFLGLLLALVAPLARAAEESRTYEVEVEENVSYYTGADASKERHALDLYLPRGGKDYPVLFFIHGGGWTAGNKSGFARHGKWLARSGRRTWK